LTSLEIIESLGNLVGVRLGPTAVLVSTRFLKC